MLLRFRRIRFTGITQEADGLTDFFRRPGPNTEE
jgi:hypothetical protein